MAAKVLEDARFVLARANAVTIDPLAVARVAEAFVATPPAVPAWNDRWHFTDGTWRTANYLALLDTLNFCFWADPGQPRWAITYGNEHLRGYWALAAALKAAIEGGLDLTDAQVLADLDADTLGRVLACDAAPIPLFDRRLAFARGLGAWLLAKHEGRFDHAVAGCGGRAITLMDLLAREVPGFADVSPFEGRPIHLYKRAQILPADLYGAFGGQGIGAFTDMAELTAFADYKVPQVLNRLGILVYGDELVSKLREEIVLAAHSPAEIEIRAGAIAGTEDLRAACAARGTSWLAIELDWILWEMGLTPDPNDLPYHRTRTTAY